MHKNEKIYDIIKLLRLRSKHHWHHFFRRIQVSYLCFFLSIGLSLFILLPSLFQSVPILEMANQNGIFQYKLSLSGQLILSDDVPVEYPIRVSVGGYSEQISNGVDFALVFLSATKSNIPVVISDESGNYIVEHITFDSNSIVTTFHFVQPLGD